MFVIVGSGVSSVNTEDWHYQVFITLLFHLCWHPRLQSQSSFELFINVERFPDISAVKCISGPVCRGGSPNVVLAWRPCPHPLYYCTLVDFLCFCMCMCLLFCCILCCLLFWVFFTFLAFFPSVLWYCWLGFLTCKNRRPYNLYRVGGDVKPCSVNQSVSISGCCGLSFHFLLIISSVVHPRDSVCWRRMHAVLSYHASRHVSRL